MFKYIVTFLIIIKLFSSYVIAEEKAEPVEKEPVYERPMKGKEAVQLPKSVPTHQPPIRIRELDILIPPAPTPPEKWPATLKQPTKPEPTEKEKPAPRRLETRPPPGNPGQWR